MEWTEFLRCPPEKPKWNCSAVSPLEDSDVLLTCGLQEPTDGERRVLISVSSHLISDEATWKRTIVNVQWTIVFLS